MHLPYTKGAFDVLNCLPAKLPLRPWWGLPDGGRSMPGYSARLKVMVKVLDFIQLGGPKQTELRTFRWEVLI